MEKRGLDSPDDGDALALTFAHPVPPIEEPLDEEDEEDGGYRRDYIPGRDAWMR
jgi:hypothetical protein